VLVRHDPEPQPLVVADVAGPSRLEERGDLVAPREPEAELHQRSAETFAAVFGSDGQVVEEPGRVGGEVILDPVPERPVANTSVVGHRIDGVPGAPLDLEEPLTAVRRDPQGDARRVTRLPQPSGLGERLVQDPEQLSALFLVAAIGAERPADDRVVGERTRQHLDQPVHAFGSGQRDLDGHLGKRKL
jgi:hypothetical protein